MAEASLYFRRVLVAGVLACMALLLWWWAPWSGGEGGAGPVATPSVRAEGAASSDETGPSVVPPRRARSEQEQTALAPAQPWEGQVREEPALASGRFEGTVVNHGNGEPVPGAELVFSFLGAAESVSSDDEGRFVFTPAKTGSYQLAMATAPGFLPYAPEWESSPIALVAREGLVVSGVRVVLIPKIEYQGLVVDEADRPVSGATVVVRPGPEETLTGHTQRYVSDRNGEFRFNARDFALLVAEREGLGKGSARVDAAVQVGRKLTIRLGQMESDHGDARESLEGEARIDGEVVGPSGEPVPSFHLVVEARRGLELLGSRQQAVVDGRGRFSVLGLPEGEVEVGIAAAGYAPGRARMQASKGSGERERIQLERGSSVHGVVLDAESGEGLELAKVSLEGQVSSGSSAGPVLISDICDEEGAFELRGLPTGRHSLFVAAANHNSQLAQVDISESGGRVGPLEISLTPVAEGESPKLELAGIGAALQAVEEGMLVTRVFPESGAALAGVVEGDVILSVDGLSATELGFQGCIQRIRGPVGSTVRLGILRGEAQLELDVQRVKLRV